MSIKLSTGGYEACSLFVKENEPFICFYVWSVGGVFDDTSRFISMYIPSFGTIYLDNVCLFSFHKK